MSDWWEDVEHELQRLGDAAPDPWADFATRPTDDSLTPAQTAFLKQLAETPGNELDDDDFRDESE